MADKTDDEHLDNPTNTQSENSSDETIPIKDGEIINSNQETETMEVHHHPDLQHKPKKWKEYFIEFLMIFLAVTLGFFAENIREDQVERNRENVYMKNMLEDLKYDTASYKNYTRNSQIAYGIVDSLTFLLKSQGRKTNANKIYFLARIFTIREDLLLANERTYDQMKSSGYLRLIHKQEVADSVSYYYNSLKQINNYNERITLRINDYFLSMGKLFDASILLKITKDQKMPEGESTKLLTEDPLVINEVLTRAQYLYATFNWQQKLGSVRCQKAENLIALIKEEYHLE
jgi:hypothetical protein